MVFTARSGIVLGVACCMPAIAHAGFGRTGHAESAPESSSSDNNTVSNSYYSPSPSDSSTSVPSWHVRKSWDPADHVFGYVPNAEERVAARGATTIVWGLDAGGGYGGVLFGTRFSFEGTRFGAVADYGAALAPVPDGTAFDVIHLLHARATLLLAASPRGRFRVESGAHFAVAPLASFAAPGFGLSGAVCLAGPFGLELRAQGQLWPYTELDARIGLTVDAPLTGFSLGLRALYLNDNGALGAVNADDTDDLFLGVYIGLAVGSGV